MVDDAPEKRSLTEDDYRTARASTEAALGDQQKFLDQTVLTLAGGGLGLSIAFLKDFGSPPSYVWMLFVGGLLLVVSIIAVLLSLHTSNAAFSKYVRELDAASEAGFPPGKALFEGNYVNSAARVTQLLNWIASIFLVLGIVFLAAFGYINEARKTRTPMSNGDGIGKVVTVPTDGSGVQRGVIPIKPAVPPPPPPPDKK
ncbi:MAG TPA: hypothetical protein VII56_10810 [Rhizomicrobium sp.]